jgi:hypothetical protein
VRFLKKNPRWQLLSVIAAINCFGVPLYRINPKQGQDNKPGQDSHPDAWVAVPVQRVHGPGSSVRRRLDRRLPADGAIDAPAF